MYLCKITKREVYKNNDGTDTVIKELVCYNGSVLAKKAKKWIGEHFLPAYKKAVMTTFTAVDGFKALNSTIEKASNEPHNVYNGRATMFNEYGKPLYIIAIDIYSIEVVN